MRINLKASAVDQRTRKSRRVRFLRFEQFEPRLVLATAVDDYYTVDQGQQTGGDPLGNDSWSDPPGCSASVWLDSEPSNGSFSSNVTSGGCPGEGATLSFSYEANPGFEGVDSFSYSLADNAGSSTATVYITVLDGTDDPPVASDDSYDAPRNGQLIIDDLTGVLANDSDDEGATLSALVLQEPAHGTLTLNSDGSFAYTPHPDYFGEDTFTYKASDGIQDSGEATVTINVLPPDIAISGFTQNGAELQLQINYEVFDADADDFVVKLYASYDGVTLDQELQVVPTDTGMGNTGSHSLTFSATFADPLDDYQLVAVLDTADDIDESDEANNQAIFTGLSFPLSIPDGPTVLSIVGTDGNDIIDVTGMGTDAWLVTSGPSPELDPPTTPNGLFYDVDGDGKVTRRDAQAVAFAPTLTGFSWQNPVIKWDVNDSGTVTGADVLAIVNWSNANGWFVFSSPRGTTDPYYDASGDNIFSQLDYDMVLDKVNGNDGELENDWRNTEPLDVDDDGLVTDSDITAILEFLEVPHAVYHDLAIDQITVRGHAGSDTISVPLVDNVVPLHFYGGPGNDSLIGSGRSDRLDGGTGNDTLNAAGGDDIVSGGDGTDLISGGHGGDVIFGGLGVDTIDGGPDNDQIFGDEGNDILEGGFGNDRIYGNEGDDDLDGGDGNDDLLGGEGSDTIQGGGGDDELDGAAGEDTIEGGAGHDTLIGGADNDSLDGGDADDSLYGGDGTDTLIGGTGSNNISDNGDIEFAQIAWGGYPNFHIYEGTWAPMTMKRLPTGGLGGVSITLQLVDGDDHPFALAAGAVYGSDYGGPQTIVVEIPPGEYESEEFTIPLQLDNTIESHEVFWLHIIDVHGGYDPLGEDNAWITVDILDRTIDTYDDEQVVTTDDEVIINVLANDFGGTSELFIASFTQPQYGTVTAIYDPQDRIGALSYMRDPNHPLEETFSYLAQDNAGQEGAAVVYISQLTGRKVTGLSSSLGGRFWEGDTATFTASLNSTAATPPETFTWEMRSLISPLEDHGGVIFPAEYGPWAPLPAGQNASAATTTFTEPFEGQVRVTLNANGVASSATLDVRAQAAFPVNFRATGSEKLGTKLRVHYAWDSSSTRIADLDGVLMGEFVWQTWRGRYWYTPETVQATFPLPPFGVTTWDGFYIEWPAMMATTGQGTDTHSGGQPLVAGAKARVAMQQYYYYKVTDGAYSDPSPTTEIKIDYNTIIYDVFQDEGGNWKLIIDKSPDGKAEWIIQSFPFG